MSCGSNITSIDSHPLWLNDAFELQVMDEIVLLTCTKNTGKSLEVPSTWTSDRLWAIFVVLVSNGDTTRQRDVRRQRYDVRCVSCEHMTAHSDNPLFLYLHDTISADLAAGMHRQNWYVVRERRGDLPIFGTSLSFNVPNSHQLISAGKRK